MTALASGDVPQTQHRVARRLRAGVLGPRGGGTTRRRASDAFRFGLAVVVVAVSIPVMRANSAVELSIVRALNPPPAAIEQLTGLDAAGKTIELSVYGRDASDARVLAKVWRFCLYRDSGPTLILDRLQQVEHEAYLILTAGRAGVLVPELLAAGRFGPSRDAALVSRVPDGPPSSQVATGYLPPIWGWVTLAWMRRHEYV